MPKKVKHAEGQKRGINNYIYSCVFGRKGMPYMNKIQGVIESLGYSNSPNLCYIDDIDNRFSLQTNKILKELQPVAVYSINEKPFILFYNQINDSNRIKEINKKIWNAQIPVVIFFEENCVKVYNGSSMNFEEISLQLICEESVPMCNEYSPFSYWSIASPSFWIDYEKKYAIKKLNELLLENIKFMTGYLKTSNSVLITCCFCFIYSLRSLSL